MVHVKSRTVLFIFALAVAASGIACGFKTGFIRDARSAQVVRFNMQVQSLQFVRVASGEASYYSILCQIPIGEPLYKTAMERLYGMARLGPNETLMNIREDRRVTTYAGFLCQTRLVLSADVYRYVPARTQ